MATFVKAVPKAGKTYEAGVFGVGNVTRRYQVIYDSPIGMDDLPTTWTGVPAIGSAHPNWQGLYAIGYKVSQPDAAAKATLDVEVIYGTGNYSLSGGGNLESSVVEWGWDEGMSIIDLTHDKSDNKPIVNSAGDPFDTAPQVYVPTPTFRKVVRFAQRMANWQKCFGCVNDAEVTIGNVACATDTLLITVAERMIIGGQSLKWEYSVTMRYHSNEVKWGNSVRECGWQPAILQTGYRAKVTQGSQTRLEVQQSLGSETKTMTTVTVPILLAADGTKLADGADPVTRVIQGYDRISVPGWLYSES